MVWRYHTILNHLTDLRAYLGLPFRMQDYGHFEECRGTSDSEYAYRAQHTHYVYDLFFIQIGGPYARRLLSLLNSIPHASFCTNPASCCSSSFQKVYSTTWPLLPGEAALPFFSVRATQEHVQEMVQSLEEAQKVRSG